MVDRRQFLSAAVAGAVTLARNPMAFAAQASKYDLLIKGGRVIDPSVRLDAVRDVAIAGGRIAAVEPSITTAAAETIDARGKLVVPGLIDIHTHTGRTAESPGLVLRDGVTGWIDAGSQGADHIAEIVAVARSSPQQGRVLINIGRAGILPEGDTMDLARADVAAARDAIAKHRDFVVGVKARLSREVAGTNDYEVLRRSQEVASAFNLPVMIHMGQTISPIGKLVDLLKRGDIVTHLFAPPPNAIVDDSGHIVPEVLAARRRGVWFDIGNGQTGHMRWDTIGAIMKAGFWPDTFSTDWNVEQQDDRRHRSSQLHVEAARLRHVGQRSDRVRDAQSVADVHRCSTTAARSTLVRRQMWRCSNCAKERSSSSTTTRARSAGNSGSSRLGPCWGVSGSRLRKRGEHEATDPRCPCRDRPRRGAERSASTHPIASGN